MKNLAIAAKTDAPLAAGSCQVNGGAGAIWHVDEVFITIRGERHYLWRAVDQDGDVLDILVTRRRDKRAAKRFFRKMLKHQGRSPLTAIRPPTERFSHP